MQTSTSDYITLDKPMVFNDPGTTDVTYGKAGGEKEFDRLAFVVSDGKLKLYFVAPDTTIAGAVSIFPSNNKTVLTIGDQTVTITKQQSGGYLITNN